ncbi:hypothetical protein [Eudoraea chungangensis]|uniref:hypothetical protein n=1 Tax=Eudoraea chungangensis TaxID=1481905 RepID=UPI0023EBCC12|nr:hypothetical protein [Eudoraea chungangensis]
MNLIVIKALSVLLLLVPKVFQESNRITKEELNLITGSWKGSLTYLDYSSNKPFSMPANLMVKQGSTKQELILMNDYPQEPNANSSEKIKVSKNGEAINGYKIISKIKRSDGNLEITTEHKGKNNNKSALIRNIYILGINHLIIRKEVQFKGSMNWIRRNEFSYTR